MTFNSVRFDALTAAYHGWLVGTVSPADFASATSRYLAEIEAEREAESNESTSGRGVEVTHATTGGVK